MKIKLTAVHVCLILAGLLGISVVLFFMEVSIANGYREMAVRQQTEVIDRQAQVIEDQANTIKRLMGMEKPAPPVY